MGVCQDVARRSGKIFRAQYTLHGMAKHLGVHDNPEAAALTYSRFAAQVERHPLPVTVPLAVAAPPPAPVWAVPVASPMELPVTVPLARALRDLDRQLTVAPRARPGGKRGRGQVRECIFQLLKLYAFLHLR